MMVDPTLTQLLGEALAAPDPSMWCSQHRAQIGEEFLDAALQQLDETLRFYDRQTLALGDLAVAAAAVVEDPALADLFTRLSDDLDRANGELNVGDFTHTQIVFEKRRRTGKPLGRLTGARDK